MIGIVPIILPPHAPLIMMAALLHGIVFGIIFLLIVIHFGGD